MSLGRTRRSFTKEFKLEAVRLITEGGQSIAHVARDLGIRDTILGRWKKESEQDQDAAFPSKGHGKPEEVEWPTCDGRMSACGWNGTS